MGDDDKLRQISCGTNLFVCTADCAYGEAFNTRSRLSFIDMGRKIGYAVLMPCFGNNPFAELFNEKPSQLVYPACRKNKTVVDFGSNASKGKTVSPRRDSCFSSI